MAERPVIGITAAIEHASWAAWDQVEGNVSQRTYSVRVAAAGGLPLVLPADEASAESPEQLLGLLDGLLLSGGADLDPGSYGSEPDPRTSNHRAERDRFELSLARAAIAADLPVLGVCRGMQLLNVACGGTLIQHLPDSERHLHTPGRFSDHDVRLEPGSLAAAAAGTERLSASSHHHQGIERLGTGLTATGWAEPGDAIEAIEARDREFVLGILWHAEEQESSRVIASFVEASSSFAARRSGEVLA